MTPFIVCGAFKFYVTKFNHFFYFIQEKKKGEVKADDERSSTDKKRALRQKKKDKREKKKARESREKAVAKLNPGLGNKYSKEKTTKELEKLAKQDKSITVIKVSNILLKCVLGK